MSERLGIKEGLNFREQLKAKHFAPIGLDLGYSDFETAVEAFEEFMKLPAMYADRSRFKLDERGNATFGAFERRVGNENAEGRGLDQDNKNIFHFGSLTRQVMEHRLGAMPKEAKEFLNVAEEVYWASLRSMKDAFAALDQEHVGLVGLHFDEKQHLNHHIRFVSYYSREGELLATPHYDRSVGTIALAENKPGLWVETPGGKEYIPPRENNEGVFFLGKGWEHLPYYESLRRYEPALHGVDQLDTAAGKNGVIRWAVILFANPYEMDTVPAPSETRPYKAIGQKIFEAATA